MRALLLSAIACLAVACTPVRGYYGDPAPPVVPQVQEFTVRVVWHKDREEVQAAAAATGYTGAALEGFALISPDTIGTRWCEVHLALPAALSDAALTLIGHEFAHCTFGMFHK
jgi:hypothetical protein